MTRVASILRLLAQALLSSALLAGSSLAAAPGPDFKMHEPATVAAEFSAYDTELFNLLLNRKNVIDGRNRFDGKFSESFDRLLLGSKKISDKTTLGFIKKRLLSGPEPKPVFLSADGRSYLYYEACQAHACDETNLALLYDVESKSMRANLVVEGVSELLGSPTRSETRLLEQLKSSR